MSQLPLIFASLVLLSSDIFAAATHGKSFHKAVDEKNATVNGVILDAPPRYMWGWGEGTSGYCGSTSFQTHGIFWGNWISSEKVRDSDGGEELLIAVNDEAAAQALKFPYEEWNYDQSTPQSNAFLSWIRSHIDEGHIVVVGMYERQPSGDKDYDHIVPVIGYETAESDSATISGLYFNDLWLNTTRYLSVPAGIASRKNCRQSSEPEQPYTYCLPVNVDYGIALLGIEDVNSETFRMTLEMPSWTEPDYGKEDGINAQPVPFTINATVFGLVPGVEYTTLRFDSYATLPTQDFIHGPFTKKWTFTATAETYHFVGFDTFMSNSTIFYRTVRT